MLVGTDSIDHLPGEANAYLVEVCGLWRDVCQHAVIIAFASAQPMTLMVESHAWNDGHVNLLIVRKSLTHGFPDIQSSFFQVLLSGVSAQLHVSVADYPRQQDSFALFYEFVNQVLCLYLVR